MTKNVWTPEQATQEAKKLFTEERSLKRLEGWFLAGEAAADAEIRYPDLPPELLAAKQLEAIVERLPLSISEHALFAGTQRDAFARSYALINPSFRVETFSGYCDPTAVFGDIEPGSELTAERIEALHAFKKRGAYVKKLSAVYEEYTDYTAEVAFFIEQVTGHLIPDFRPALRYGTAAIRNSVLEKRDAETDGEKKTVFDAIALTLDAAVTLAHRYAAIAAEMKKNASGAQQDKYALMEKTLRKVPESGCETLYEAIQAYLLLWQVMCLEQAPNPFAFSVGNADRIFEPYRLMSGETRDEAAALFKHFLVYYNVGDRSWAISQNVLLSGRDTDGKDLTNLSTYAILDAYYDMNLPQPILSVKLHKNTPAELYSDLGRFFFTPGCLTPSLFNDDSMFKVLATCGVEEADLPDYSVAGCQEPLIMGKDNANTTNSWLNLPKILELTLNSGLSLISGMDIGTAVPEKPALERLRALKEDFFANVDWFTGKMADAANGASRAIAFLPVPFLSAFMGGAESGIDMRDTKRQGTKYNGSGCLIHGLSVIADSLEAVEHLVAERPQDAEKLLEALRADFVGFEALRDYLLGCPKYGNNIDEVDRVAVEVASRVSDIVRSKKNYLGNPFRADWSSPSTHLLYGYWVGATPDGRHAREQLNYGIDPLYGEAGSGLGFRILSNMKLPFLNFNGGYASHFGIDPKFFSAEDFEAKGGQFAERVITPLFFNDKNEDICPYYLYVNVTTPETLRKVLADPKKYAPSGIYIMRIHGTFVNFLDLSPAIQQDIIKRLDLESTALKR